MSQDVASTLWSKQNNDLCRSKLPFEQQLFVPRMRKPFDVLAEVLISKNSRGDQTAIELFLSGIRGWEAGLRRRIDDGNHKYD